tara:strand:+ start:16686 stop:17879 length:1194 start_codon:yes stop_codon:yes gene_type:complete
VFHDDCESYVASLRQEGKESEPILFDLHAKLSDGQDCFARLKDEFPERTLIGFEEYEPDLMNDQSGKVDGLKHYLLLPPQAGRAKARLKSMLGEIRVAQNKSPASVGKSGARGFRRAFNPSAGARTLTGRSKLPGASAVEKSFRYITAVSPVSRDFGKKLIESLSFETVMILSGEEGAELILAAREIQYQIHGDEEMLHIVSGDEVSLDLLHRIEKKAKDAGKPRLCYIEGCDEASAESLRELLQFVENMENIRNPHLRLILGQEAGAGFLYEETVGVFADLVKKSVQLELPPLAYRLEDVRPIVNGFLSGLTMAHPFLVVKEIAPEALRYLEENRAEFSYKRLVQVLRNSIALGQERILSAETLRNLETQNTISEHLIESTADEAFFPLQESCSAT